MRISLKTSHLLHLGLGLALLLAATGFKSGGVAQDPPSESGTAFYRTGNLSDHQTTTCMRSTRARWPT
jgi:hypothetical protein